MRDLPFSTTPILFGVVLYLLSGCSTLFPDKEKESPTSNSETAEVLAQKVKAVEAEISNGEPNADLLYQKGYLLGELAQKKDAPSKRKTIYQDMHDALVNARSLFQDSELPLGTQKVDDLLKVRWSNEHNQGVQIIQTDSALIDNQYLRATAYFENATIILPDTTISYRMKAQTHYKHNDFGKAITTLEKAQKNIEQLPVEMLEQLAFIYLENEQNNEAIAVYEQAKSFSDDNLNLIHGLSNAYIKIGNHKEAVELLNLLIENNPENILYRQTQGTELYFLASDIFQEISETTDSAAVANNLQKIDTLLSDAEVHYRKALSENPEDEELKKALVRFYQNNATKYQRLLVLINQGQADYVKAKIATYLQQSIPLYEELLAENPADDDMLKKLSIAYTYLGMEKEAKELN